MLMVPDKYAQPCTERQINEMLDVDGLYNLAPINKLMRHLILMVATQPCAYRQNFGTVEYDQLSTTEPRERLHGSIPQPRCP